MAISPSTIQHSLSTFSVATWNVNSVRQRLPLLLEWLDRDKPDVVLLQEIKCVDEQFPGMEIEELGYNIATHGEKSYNGVAILSKYPLSDITRHLPGADDDIQSRYIEAVVSLPGRAARVASVYVPNGQSTDSDKFPYKLRFLDRLYAHAKTLLPYEEMLIIGGDYNVAPEPIDVYDPKRLDGSICFHPEERKRFRALQFLGLYDALRLKHPHTPELYSYWDYRASSHSLNHGWRIDHLLLSPQAADKLTACSVVTDFREREKASDHAAVIGTFKI